MNIIKRLLIGLAAIAVLLAGIGWFLPRTAHVERSALLEAPPAVVFTVLNGYHSFNQWSPWLELDPDAKLVFEGPATGVGAKMSWEGNSEVGFGSQEILESQPYERIRQRLTFGGFDGDFTSTYLLSPEGEGTRLVWRFDADYGNSLVGRYFGLLSERMVGPDYEKGLARLAAFVARLPRGDFGMLRIEPVETAAEPIVYMAVRSAANANAIGVALSVAWSRLYGFAHSEGLRPAGAPLAIYRNREEDTLLLEAAIPVDRAPAAAAEPIRAGTLPAGRAMRATYQGSYAGLGAVHDQIQAYIAAAGLERNGDAWERYVSDPAKTAPAELITEVYYPIQ